jgi:hypothetical protein
MTPVHVTTTTSTVDSTQPAVIFQDDDELDPADLYLQAAAPPPTGATADEEVTAEEEITWAGWDTIDGHDPR